MTTRTFNTPEELVYVSKFRIGDWVQFIDSDSTKYFGRCLDIRDTYHSDYGKITVVDVDWTDVGHFTQDIEPWQPQEGEWCWLYGKLIKITDIPDVNHCQCITYTGDEEYSYEYLQANCEPFIGTLPTFLSGK